MARLLRFLLKTVIVLAVVMGVVLVGARFADGPVAIIAGGEFSSGQWYEGDEPDWTFVKDIETVEFQSLAPVRSRTTWILEVDGRIFIPCGYMTSTWGRIWKQWPIEAEADGRAILRVNGVRYHRGLNRLIDDPIVPAVLAELSRKYVGGDIALEAVTSDALWLFEMTPSTS